ncbi:hypothetical protein LIER_28317 [Lithospermum erythrorhizon]|uniref:Uncharacterized protein n=1 Tax=Lithospermum erythrorhizon TaxID=34254 RepID=A0AAV3RIQ8_LITER
MGTLQGTCLNNLGYFQILEFSTLIPVEFVALFHINSTNVGGNTGGFLSLDSDVVEEEAEVVARDQGW